MSGAKVGVPSGLKHVALHIAGFRNVMGLGYIASFRCSCHMHNGLPLLIGLIIIIGLGYRLDPIIAFI